jgi:hypothetical protein
MQNLILNKFNYPERLRDVLLQASLNEAFDVKVKEVFDEY